MRRGLLSFTADRSVPFCKIGARQNGVSAFAGIRLRLQDDPNEGHIYWRSILPRGTV
jgi:hypothetical protein